MDMDSPLGTYGVYVNRQTLRYPYFNTGIGLLMTSYWLLAIEILIIKTVGVESMLTASLIGTIFEGLTTLSLPK